MEITPNLIAIGGAAAGKTRALEKLIADIHANGGRAVVIDPRGEVQKKLESQNGISIDGKTDDEITDALLGWGGDGVLFVTGGKFNGDRISSALDIALTTHDAAFVIDEWLPEMSAVLNKHKDKFADGDKNTLAVAMHDCHFSEAMDEPWLGAHQDRARLMVFRLGYRQAADAIAMRHGCVLGLCIIQPEVLMHIQRGTGFIFKKGRAPWLIEF